MHTGETFKPHRVLELDSQSFLCHVWPISFVFFITIIEFSSQINVWSSVTGPIVVVKVHHAHVHSVQVFFLWANHLIHKWHVTSHSGVCFPKASLASYRVASWTLWERDSSLHWNILVVTELATIVSFGKWWHEYADWLLAPQEHSHNQTGVHLRFEKLIVWDVGESRIFF